MSQIPKAKINGAKQQLQALVVVAVAVLVATVCLVVWLNGKIAAQGAQTTAMNAKVGSSEQIAKRLQDTQATFAATSQKIAFLDTSVSQKGYVPTLLQQVQALAVKSDLTVTTVQPSPILVPTPVTTGGKPASKTAPPPPYDTMNVNIDVTGSYAATQQFLYGLTHFPKVISVVGINMSPGASTAPAAGAQTGATVTSDMHLVAYIFPDPTAPAAGSPSTTTVAPHVASEAGSSSLVGAAVHAANSAVSVSRTADSRSALGVGAL